MVKYNLGKQIKKLFLQCQIIDCKIWIDRPFCISESFNQTQFPLQQKKLWKTQEFNTFLEKKYSKLISILVSILQGLNKSFKILCAKHAKWACLLPHLKREGLEGTWIFGWTKVKKICSSFQKLDDNLKNSPELWESAIYLNYTIISLII